MIILFFTACAGFATMDKEKKQDSIGSISFSPDGKKILFHRSKGGNPYYMIQVYDLQTGELSAYKSPDGEQWGQARYSFDGESIVFEILPYKEKQWDIANSQLAIMTPDGSKVRKITSSSGFKGYPSFSHSDKKVIYIKSGIIRKEGKTPAMDYDIHEVDLETGKETRLTWFKFFEISEPYYLPNDERIIFSAFGTPRMFPGIAENDSKAIRKKQAELDAKSLQLFNKLGDNIYIVKKEQKELPEPLIKSKDGLRDPLITMNGTIFFETQAYKPDGKGDGTQYFQFSADGKHRRITNLHATTIWSAAVSNDGALLAVVYDVAPAREIKRIVLYQVKDGTSREITLPDQPSRIINSQ